MEGQNNLTQRWPVACTYRITQCFVKVNNPGFGEKEHFPRLFEYRVVGLFEGQVWKSSGQNVKVSERQSASITAFAQTDVVHTFLRGIDPHVEKFFSEFLYESFEEIKKISNTKRVTKTCEDLLKGYNDKHSDYLYERHIDPMLSMIDVLPKDELARMAEALVSITSLKRRVSQDLETVGGPIDVAVISKGDGLIWIDRKHYFDPAKNPDYFERTGIMRRQR